jgi:hypothetical protein
MADQLNTFVAVCAGGLVTNTDPLHKLVLCQVVLYV